MKSRFHRVNASNMGAQATQGDNKVNIRSFVCIAWRNVRKVGKYNFFPLVNTQDQYEFRYILVKLLPEILSEFRVLSD